MINNLKINSLAVIESLNVEFSDGLNIITGETGAGKSIIINALQLLLGERASSELIRKGADKASVEASFNILPYKNVRKHLEQSGLLDIDDPGSIIIRRELSASGANRCFINGNQSTLAQLKSLGDMLVDLHGQHEHQTLLKTDAQRELLDAFGGLEIRVDDFSKQYENLFAIIKKLDDLNKNKQENERKKDFVQFQINEIEKAELNPDEEEDLGKNLQRLRHAEKLKNSASLCYDILYEGESCENPVINLLSDVETNIAAIASLDEGAKSLSDEMAEISTRIESLARSVREYRDDIQEDPETLQALELRQDLLKELKKKYGTSIPEILAFAEKIRTELNYIVNADEEMGKLATEIIRLEKSLAETAAKISRDRKSAAIKLEKEMNKFLKDLNLPHAVFSVKFDEYTSVATESGDNGNEPVSHKLKFGKHGADKIDFLFCANPGEELKPLRKVASGGELSRIMLALKSHLAQKDQVPTVVFDEVDAGIGGETAGRVGNKLAGMSKTCQIICITHIPQIACFADSHYVVRKQVEKSRTFTNVFHISKEESKQEIARMLGGDELSQVSLKHAEELIARKK